MPQPLVSGVVDLQRVTDSMPRAIVELREITKRFGSGPPVLEHITLRATEGEFIGLIGPSGCGKSTLLRLLAGLTKPTGGTLAVNDGDVSQQEGGLAFVFQDPTLLPWLSVRENIELPLRLRQMTPAAAGARCEAALRLTRLDERATAFPRELSGGQRMRVSLARALVLRPRLLLLDEPFGALDEMTREHLNEELLAIRSQTAWTAFFVTHSVHEAVFLASRVLVLSANPGRIHADISIPLPYPRTADTRLEPEFHALVSSVSRTLRAVDNPAP